MRLPRLLPSEITRVVTIAIFSIISSDILYLLAVALLVSLRLIIRFLPTVRILLSHRVLSERCARGCTHIFDVDHLYPLSHVS